VLPAGRDRTWAVAAEIESIIRVCCSFGDLKKVRLERRVVARLPGPLAANSAGRLHPPVRARACRPSTPPGPACCTKSSMTVLGFLPASSASAPRCPELRGTDFNWDHHLPRWSSARRSWSIGAPMALLSASSSRAPAPAPVSLDTRLLRGASDHRGRLNTAAPARPWSGSTRGRTFTSSRRRRYDYTNEGA
jgi:hypothetical protein